MPPDDQMLHAPSKGRRPDPPLARSRLPLALTAGRAARQADLWHLEEVYCAHGHARDQRDRSRVHPGEQQWCVQRSTTRQATQDTMAQGRRRGLARTREVSLEYELGRKEKERTSEVARSSKAEKLDVMIMTWARREASSRVYPWRIEWMNARPELACGMIHSTKRISRIAFARIGRQSVCAAWQQVSSVPSKALPAHT